jgi:hypothetical protein
MLEEIIPIQPIHFFAIGANCHYYGGKKESSLPAKYQCPDLFSHFYEETPFAKLFLGWSEKGLFCTFQTLSSFGNVHFPDTRSGDAIELFIDTRDAKKSGPITRFCHHFCILPEPFENESQLIQALEITRFRGSDVRPLADSSLIFVESEKKIRGREVRIFLPREVLYGYDPSQFERLGFSYRINRSTGLPQYFSVSGEEVALESHPSFWASLNLVK